MRSLQRGLDIKRIAASARSASMFVGGNASRRYLLGAGVTPRISRGKAWRGGGRAFFANGLLHHAAINLASSYHHHCGSVKALPHSIVGGMALVNVLPIVASGGHRLARWPEALALMCARAAAAALLGILHRKWPNFRRQRSHRRTPSAPRACTPLSCHLCIMSRKSAAIKLSHEIEDRPACGPARGEARSIFVTTTAAFFQ